MLKSVVTVFVGLLLALSASANEAEIKKAMESRLGVKIDSVAKANYMGLYEVYANGEIFYTDEKVSAILAGGQLFDAKNMRNVTKERMGKFTAIRFSDLVLERAIKQVRGDGKRVIATFEDPNCGYCKRLAKDLLKLDNVTVYTFLYPILSEDSLQKSKQIWCSANPAKSWNEWMIEGKALSGKTSCDTAAINKNLEFGQSLKSLITGAPAPISGTPTIIFADGERFPGALPLAEIEKKLASIK